MIKEAIDRILSLADIKTLVFEGREFTSQKVYEVDPALPQTLEVNTLTALVDYANSKIDGELDKCAIHVFDEEDVRLVTSLHENYLTRGIIAKATRKNHSQGFKFGQTYDAERFIIELQSHFNVTADLTKILKVVGNMKAEKITSSSDDGITQTVSTRAGVVLSSTQDVPNPVILEPYRTFLEVDQPQSAFVFRVHQSKDGELPKCALYEADGGKWKLEAIGSIMTYFKKNLPKVPVIA